MNIVYRYTAALAASLLLAACSSNPKEEETTASTAQPQASQEQQGLSAAALEERRRSEARALQVEKLEERRLVYFEFDESGIKPQYRDLITAHAKYLGENPDIQVRLEGHADERGTREYNVALGERRAKAVRQALMLQGVTDEQLATSSYGEELPAVIDASSERSYSRNRRVEFHYLSGELAQAPLSHENPVREDRAFAASQPRLEE